MEQIDNKIKDKKLRPETPSIDIIAIRNQGDNSGVIKNFSSLFKQIITNENKNFIEGEINMIEYIISKYTNISVNKVNEINKLHLKINFEYNLLNQFGEKLPILKELKLSGSNLPSIMDLGSNFKNLMVLNMDNCNLSDLSGICCLVNLKEFSAKNNKISDLIELDPINTLIYLQLENNRIEDIENITFLSNLDQLDTLILKGNPIALNHEYNCKIKEYLPWLANVDIEYTQQLNFENPAFSSTNNSFYSKNSKESNKLKSLKNSNKNSNENSNNNTFIQEKEMESIEKEFNLKHLNILNRSTNDSNITNANSNSLQVSTSTFKSKNTNNESIFKLNRSNILNIHIDDSNLSKLGKTQLKPVKIKSVEEREKHEKQELKKVFATHNECLDLEQEKEEIMKKLDKKTFINNNFN